MAIAVAVADADLDGLQRVQPVYIGHRQVVNAIDQAGVAGGDPVETAPLPSPNAPASAKIPDSSRAGDLISITWRESTAASDAVVQPLWSGDLLQWESEGFAIEVTGSAAGWVEKRATFAAASHRRVCLQLRVSLP